MAGAWVIAKNAECTTKASWRQGTYLFNHHLNKFSVDQSSYYSSLMPCHAENTS